MAKSLDQASIEIGKSKKYLAVIKCYHKTIFRFISIFGKGDAAKGHRGYVAYKKRLQDKIADEYFKYEKATTLANKLVEKGFYSYVQLPHGIIGNIIASKEINLKQVRTAKRILKEIKA